MKLTSSPDPDVMLANNLFCDTEWNVARWCNKDFQNLLMKARETTDKAKRKEYYGKAQVIFNKDIRNVSLG